MPINCGKSAVQRHRYLVFRLDREANGHVIDVIQCIMNRFIPHEARLRKTRFALCSGAKGAGELEEVTWKVPLSGPFVAKRLRINVTFIYIGELQAMLFDAHSFIQALRQIFNLQSFK